MKTDKAMTTTINIINSEWTDLEDFKPEDYVDRCIRIGEELISLKEQCKNKGVQFLTCFAGSKKTAMDTDKVKFPEREGQKYMATARNDYFKTAATAGFPKDVNVLSFLGIRLTSRQIRSAVEKNMIYPSMGYEGAQLAVAACEGTKDEVPVDVIWQRRYVNAQRAIGKLQSSQLRELFVWLKKQLEDAA